MPQQGWNIVTRTGRHYNLGLYHGDQTGHVVLHCNASVMLIDFGIQEDKTYSFFLDEELCELIIKAVPDGYTYTCRIDYETATPLNEQSKADDRQQWKRARWLGLGILGGAALLSLLFISMFGQTDASDIQAAIREGKSRSTTTVVSATADARSWEYDYLVGEQIFHARVLGEVLYTPYGLPIEAGDEFVVHYLPQEPSFSYLDWQQPTPQQVDRYVVRLATHHAQLHPELAARQARCQVQLAYDLQGMIGLASIYHQQSSVAENPDYNIQSYGRLIRDPAFVQGARDCL